MAHIDPSPEDNHVSPALLKRYSRRRFTDCRHLCLRRSDIYGFSKRNDSLATVDAEESAGDGRGVISDTDRRDTEWIACEYSQHPSTFHNHVRRERKALKYSRPHDPKQYKALCRRTKSSLIVWTTPSVVKALK